MKLNQKWLSQLPIEKIISCESVHGGDMNEALELKLLVKLIS